MKNQFIKEYRKLAERFTGEESKLCFHIFSTYLRSPDNLQDATQFLEFIRESKINIPDTDYARLQVITGYVTEKQLIKKDDNYIWSSIYQVIKDNENYDELIDFLPISLEPRINYLLKTEYLTQAEKAEIKRVSKEYKESKDNNVKEILRAAEMKGSAFLPSLFSSVGANSLAKNNIAEFLLKNIPTMQSVYALLELRDKLVYNKEDKVGAKLNAVTGKAKFRRGKKTITKTYKSVIEAIDTQIDSLLMKPRNEEHIFLQMDFQQHPVPFASPLSQILEPIEEGIPEGDQQLEGFPYQDLELRPPPEVPEFVENKGENPQEVSYPEGYPYFRFSQPSAPMIEEGEGNEKKAVLKHSENLYEVPLVLENEQQPGLPQNYGEGNEEDSPPVLESEQEPGCAQNALPSFISLCTEEKEKEKKPVINPPAQKAPPSLVDHSQVTLMASKKNPKETIKNKGKSHQHQVQREVVFT